MDKTLEQRLKNSTRQKKYRESLQEGNQRISVVIKRENHMRLKEIAARNNLSQGDVLNGILEGKIRCNAENEGIGFETKLILLDGFLRSENAMHCISMMLGANLRAIMEEEGQANPDPLKIAALRAEEKKLLKEQGKIYSGDIKTQEACIKKYAPIIKDRLSA